MTVSRRGLALLISMVAAIGLFGIVSPLSAEDKAASNETSAGVVHAPSPEGAQVYIVSPKDGDVVSSPVTVVFGLKGMGVAPAGVEMDNTGHHHLLVDTKLPPFDEFIPKDEHHLHFGGGQTQTTLELAPGVHTLQLLFADYQHLPHDPPLYSEVVTITVK